MPYYATRMECPHCNHIFGAWFHANVPPNADAKYRVRCPMNASLWVLSAAVFKLVEAPPVDGVEAHPATGDDGPWRVNPRILDALSEPLPPSPKPRKWWQFWKR